MEGVLIALAVLACPVGMGLMMWFMHKGMKRSESAREQGRELSVEGLRSEQARLEAEIERLEQAQRSSDGAPARR